jgi:hypothetical protein
MIGVEAIINRPGAGSPGHRGIGTPMASRKSKKDRLPRRMFNRARGPAIPPGSRVVYEPEGREKMSAVLEDFVEPFRDMAESHEEFNKLLGLGMLAWNAALLPEDKRRAMVADMLAAGFSRAPAADRAAARQLIDALIRRKEEHFATNRRAIISFQLVDRGDDFHLSVAATL